MPSLQGVQQSGRVASLGKGLLGGLGWEINLSHFSFDLGNII